LASDIGLVDLNIFHNWIRNYHTSVKHEDPHAGPNIARYRSLNMMVNETPRDDPHHPFADPIPPNVSSQVFLWPYSPTSHNYRAIELNREVVASELVGDVGMNYPAKGNLRSLGLYEEEKKEVPFGATPPKPVIRAERQITYAPLQQRYIRLNGIEFSREEFYIFRNTPL